MRRYQGSGGRDRIGVLATGAGVGAGLVGNPGGAPGAGVAVPGGGNGRRRHHRGRRAHPRGHALLLLLGGGSRDPRLLLGGALGGAARPFAQALYVTRLREVERAEHCKADNGRKPGVGADLLNVMHTPCEP